MEKYYCKKCKTELNENGVWSKSEEPIIEKQRTGVILAGVCKYICRKCGSCVEIKGRE